MRKRNLILVLLLLLSVSTIHCGSLKFKFRYEYDENIKPLLKVKPIYPETSFIVLSDIHYYDASLGISGSEFEKYLNSDRKLLRESSEIFEAVIEDIKGKEADFVIISGDLTKDGEMVSHQGVAFHLKKLLDSGKKVFVVPGNHDVANGKSVRYQDDKTFAVPNVSKTEFEKIYTPYGYGAAIKRDPASLSYVTEPVPGLWLLALDSCRWQENKSNYKAIDSGRFSNETLEWIEQVLIESKEHQKPIIAFMHHGIWEHYPGNKKFYPQYMVDNFEHVAKMLATYNVSLVFTGHFHAQDITLAKFEGPERFIFDIETGSIVTYPCPYRIVNISKGQTATIKSGFTTSISSYKADFSNYAKNYCFEKSVFLVNAALKKYYVSETDITIINAQVAEALMTHLAGDEEKKEEPIDTEGLGLWGKFIYSVKKDLIKGWYNDLEPSDNKVTIDLKSGSVL
jgi:3',5'-cyclic AMP phosphodiesterase CpdA